jgi:gas vesicle protein
MFTREERSMISKQVFFGVIAGAAAGAIVGMLFAPAKGSVTRRRIVRKGTEYAEDAKKTFDKYTDALSDEYTAIKEGAKDWVEKGKDKAVSLVRAHHTT